MADDRNDWNTRNVNDGKTGPLIVAGVVALALILGVSLWASRDNNNAANIEPAAGNSQVQSGYNSPD